MSTCAKRCRAVLSLLTLSVLACVVAWSQQLADVSAQTPLSTASHADSSSKSSAGVDQNWRFNVTPFLWFPGVHGTVGALGRNTSIHVSGADVLSNFNFGLMGAVEPQKKRFLAPISFLWVRLSDSKGLPINALGQTSVKADLTQFILTPRIGYRVVDNDRWKLDALAGIRYWHLGQTLKLQPSNLGQSRSGNWVDGLGGARIELALTPKASVTVLGDAGGGGASSDYDVSALMNFKAKPWVVLFAGWSYLDVNYSGKNLFLLDVAQSGPILGLTFTFGGKSK